MNKSCIGCSGICCRYVTLDIDTPEGLEDFENIKWYLCHKNVEVFVDEEGIWNVRFLSDCKYLDKENKCRIYESRPEICKEFSPVNCPHNKNYIELLNFKTIVDVEEYIETVFKKGKHLIVKY